jgi:kynurenine formamidase
MLHAVRSCGASGLLACGLSIACASPGFPSAGRWVDLTHTYDEDTIYWPTSQRFQLEQLSHGWTDKGYFYASNRFSTAEHGGTHVDAPLHFAEGGSSVEQIPVDQLIGPAVVVDVIEACRDDRAYQVTVADLAAWERRHGPIPDGAIVLLCTGYGSRWPDAEAYMGTAERGEAAVASLHFPGLAPEAASWLVEQRSIGAVGLDTPSIDFGQSTLYESHVRLFEAGVPAFENVARLDDLPPSGAWVCALPMKIGGGSGAPLRIVAWVSE